jgi:predicted MFS family arabinose efflux permease
MTIFRSHSPDSGKDKHLWAMLLALAAGFALSQAFRTTAAILAVPLERDFSLSPQQIGLFAGAFHFAFGGLQLLMGIGIDVYGVRRTILLASPLTVIGAVMAAMAPSFGWLVAGQMLIGVGCAPAFLVCTVFIARHFPASRFAAVSGTVMGLSSIGMLMTGTPLAWLVDAWSWRAGFGALALLSTMAWGAIFWRLHEPELPRDRQIRKPARMGLGAALASYGVLLRQPFTWGILALSAVGYAAFITLRGLWLGPLLVTRNGLSLVGTGNVVLVLSVISIFSAPIYGRIDPGEPHKRRRWICRSALASAAILCLMALVHSLVLEIGCAMALGVLSGNAVLQYADVRRAYPPDQTGRAMAVFTMAMFMGVALMQWATGALASLALAAGIEPYGAVLIAMAALLAAGVAAFARLPAPPDEAVGSHG